MITKKDYKEALKKVVQYEREMIEGVALMPHNGLRLCLVPTNEAMNLIINN